MKFNLGKMICANEFIVNRSQNKTHKKQQSVRSDRCSGGLKEKEGLVKIGLIFVKGICEHGKNGSGQ